MPTTREMFESLPPSERALTDQRLAVVRRGILDLLDTDPDAGPALTRLGSCPPGRFRSLVNGTPDDGVVTLQGLILYAILAVAASTPDD